VATETIAELMTEFRQGSKDAAGKLTKLLYPELRRIAVLRMKEERSGHTWQPTVLVNELYLELLKVGKLPSIGSEPHDTKDSFLNFAAFLMKRILIHHARPLPSRVQKVILEETARQEPAGAQALAEIDDVLSRLARISPKLRALVEMKVFEGLSREEIAERLGCTPRTVTRQWDFARTWLQHELTETSNA
jgi:RNA polymerase sigma factor (TIGR02999 family)